MNNDAASSKIRAFVAIELSENIMKLLSGIQRALKSNGLSGKGFVRPEHIHLTLKFLGGVERNRLNDAKAALKKSAEGVKAFAVEVEGLGAFPNLKNPRVAWTGVKDSAELAGLYARVEGEFFAANFKKEGRPFKPHLTLARIRAVEDARHLCKAAEAIGQVKEESFTASGLTLFESRLSLKGAEYKIIEKASFKA